MKYPRAEVRIFELALQKQNKMFPGFSDSNSLVGRKGIFNFPFFLMK